MGKAEETAVVGTKGGPRERLGQQVEWLLADPRSCKPVRTAQGGDKDGVLVTPLPSGCSSWLAHSSVLQPSLAWELRTGPHLAHLHPYPMIQKTQEGKPRHVTEAVASSTFYIIQVLEQGGTASPHTAAPLSSRPSHVPSAFFFFLQSMVA